MSLFNSPTDVIIEAANLDLGSTGDIALESAINDFNNEYDSIPTLDESTIVYDEEVVPVFAYNDMAVVELENVVKFMESQGIEDIEEAVKMIAEHYNVEELGVVIESDCECKKKKKDDDDDDDDDFDDDFEEACATRNVNKAKKKELKVATESLISLKNKGFKLFKKPSKKKAKKKKKC